MRGSLECRTIRPMAHRPGGERASSPRSILSSARRRGERALSEHDSKRILAAYGVPTPREALVTTATQACAAARRIGYPVVLKVCAAGESHKSDKGLVVLGLEDPRRVRQAFAALRARVGRGYAGAFLVQQMVRGSRELMIGMVRDAQFGPCVMFGLGGIFSEILEDVVFRVAPLSQQDAREMLRGIRAARLLDAVRGLEAVDVDALARMLIAVGRLGLEHPEIVEVDINPLVVERGRPVAVDALVVLGSRGA
jgi:acyl-CoA synthetase (NDP forming)